MQDNTVGPILSWTTEAMLNHVENLKRIPGAALAFGGKELEGHTIPERYGAIVPTAVFVPLKEILDPKNFELVTTEVFGPVQVSHAIPADKMLLNLLECCVGQGILCGLSAACIASFRII